MQDVSRIHLTASGSPDATEALRALTERYRSSPPEQADVIVALGGDGFMLEVVHRFASAQLPIYGMNRGSVGFLMNEYHKDDLLERIGGATADELHPLRMRAETENGSVVEALAFNEVSLLRQARQAAKIRITVDGVVRLEELACDGVLLSTPAGSTAYNLSAHGPIVPLGSQLLALTPVSPFRPRRWRGALLPSSAEVRLDVQEGWKRPVSAVADDTEVRNVTSAEIVEDRSRSVKILFDEGHNLTERILREQFDF